MESSPYASLIEISAKQGDLFHTNTIEVLDGRFAERLPSLRRGNVLLSLREVNAVVILDMERRQVVWAMAGLGLGVEFAALRGIGPKVGITSGLSMSLLVLTSIALVLLFGLNGA